MSVTQISGMLKGLVVPAESLLEDFADLMPTRH